MDITYLGLSSFLIKGKNASVVTDPFDEKVVGIKFPRTEADIVTISHDHPDHNAISNVSGATNVFRGPGEYEAKGASFVALPSYHDDKKGELRGKNTIFIIEIDGLRIGHFGDIGHNLSEKLLSDIGDLNIAMIPVGGEFTIDSEDASEMARSVGASITIPMHYLLPDLNKETFGNLSAPEDFLTRVGLPLEKTTKLILKPELLSEDQKVVMFDRR